MPDFPDSFPLLTDSEQQDRERAGLPHEDEDTSPAMASEDVKSPVLNNASSDGSMSHERELRVDRHGLPLRPQPSQDPKDPLNWPKWLKLSVLLQLAATTLMSFFTASLIAPAFTTVAEALHQSVPNTSYLSSIFIAAGGLGPLLWSPLSNVYGRRPIFLISLAVSTALAGVSGTLSSYGSLLAVRALNGFFYSVPLGIGNAMVTDLFFEHERGFYMGIYTVSFVTGGHMAPIVGGFITRDISWRWCFYVPAIVTGVLFFSFLLTVPETLYHRAAMRKNNESFATSSWMDLLTMRASAKLVGNSTGRRLRAIDFWRPFQMLTYPSVLVPVLQYSVLFSYGGVLFVLTSSQIYAKLYHFQPWQTGLLLGVPITVGGLLGEAVGGDLSDYISERRAINRANGARRPEDRLLSMIPASFLSPLGVIIVGVCIQHKTHWIGPAMGTGITSFGLQIATTAIYSYTAECYRPQAAEIGALLNLGRQEFSFAMGFYAIEFGELIGFQDAWITLAMIAFGFYLVSIVLWIYGERWRARLGSPSFGAGL